MRPSRAAPAPAPAPAPATEALEPVAAPSSVEPDTDAPEGGLKPLLDGGAANTAPPPSAAAITVSGGGGAGAATASPPSAAAVAGAGTVAATEMAVLPPSVVAVVAARTEDASVSLWRRNFSLQIETVLKAERVFSRWDSNDDPVYTESYITDVSIVFMIFSNWLAYLADPAIPTKRKSILVELISQISFLEGISKRLLPANFTEQFLKVVEELPAEQQATLLQQFGINLAFHDNRSGVGSYLLYLSQKAQAKVLNIDQILSCLETIKQFSRREKLNYSLNLGQSVAANFWVLETLFYLKFIDRLLDSEGLTAAHVERLFALLMREASFRDGYAPVSFWETLNYSYSRDFRSNYELKSTYLRLMEKFVAKGINSESIMNDLGKMSVFTKEAIIFKKAVKFLETRANRVILIKEFLNIYSSLITKERRCLLGIKRLAMLGKVCAYYGDEATFGLYLENLRTLLTLDIYTAQQLTEVLADTSDSPAHLVTVVGLSGSPAKICGLLSLIEQLAKTGVDKKTIRSLLTHKAAYEGSAKLSLFEAISTSFSPEGIGDDICKLLASLIILDCLDDIDITRLAEYQGKILNQLLLLPGAYVKAVFPAGELSPVGAGAGSALSAVASTLERDHFAQALASFDPETPIGRFLSLVRTGSAEAKASKVPLSEASAIGLRGEMPRLYALLLATRPVKEGSSVVVPVLSEAHRKNLAFLKDDIVAHILSLNDLDACLEALNPETPIGSFLYLSRGASVADSSRGQLARLVEFARTRIAEVYAKIRAGELNEAQLKALANLKEVLVLHIKSLPEAQRFDDLVHAIVRTSPLGEFFYIPRNENIFAVVTGLSEASTAKGVLAKLKAELMSYPPKRLHDFIIEECRADQFTEFAELEPSLASYVGQKSDEEFWEIYQGIVGFRNSLSRYYFVLNDNEAVSFSSPIMKNLNLILATKVELLLAKLESGEIKRESFGPMLREVQTRLMAAMQDLTTPRYKELLVRSLRAGDVLNTFLVDREAELRALQARANTVGGSTVTAASAATRSGLFGGWGGAHATAAASATAGSAAQAAAGAGAPAPGAAHADDASL